MISFCLHRTADEVWQGNSTSSLQHTGEGGLKDRSRGAAAPAAGWHLAASPGKASPEERQQETQALPHAGLPASSSCTVFFRHLLCLCLSLSPCFLPTLFPSLCYFAVSRKNLFSCWQRICNKGGIGDLAAASGRRELFTAGASGYAHSC